VTPHDSLELDPGDVVEVRFRGVPGLRARAILGRQLAAADFTETSGDFTETADFMETAVSDSAPAWAWYRAELRLPRTRPLPAFGAPQPLAIEVARGGEVLLYTLPQVAVGLRDPAAGPIALLDDDPARRGDTDGSVVGRTAPDGVYFLFLPNGTRAATGRRTGDLVELRLDDDLSVWAARADVHPLPASTPKLESRVPAVRALDLGRWTRILIPLETRLPVQVRQRTDPARYEITVFGARAAAEFLRYDRVGGIVRELRWNQPANDRFVLEVELTHGQPWGFRYGYDGNDLYLDVRHPPRLRKGLFGSILRGVKIVVDPGHSPDPGAVGPTGLAEKDVNLAVGLELAHELRERGADVVLTRDAATPPDSGPGLNDRTNLAASEEADLLVSVHHNALPDGVNPFESHGTSTFHYHPQSLPLARAIQRELLRELGLRDLGVAIGNLALARPTAMPAVLVESAFMMIPEQEEMLRTEQFRRREARAIRRGLERFLEKSLDESLGEMPEESRD
ncbi:MAG: N-acetylmuramoyl-L-alanine amidase, partial [Gemmatimonadetes bacterium]|nr:N-acetylmuramoyl-L-alanine amidase [Gemmatimonadota bacterium]